MNENGNGNGSSSGGGGGSIGGDSSDSSVCDSKVCRDFMRNVCQRGKNCRFIHPENIRIRTDPIYCHDFQQGRCFRSNCKFVHATKEDGDQQRPNGESPNCVQEIEDKVVSKRAARPPKNKVSHPRNGPINGETLDEIPLCKDFLKGVCDRPPGGCKFRHARVPSSGVPSYGRTIRVGRVGPPAPVGSAVRRKGLRDPLSYEDAPEAKRYGYSPYDEDYSEERLGYSPLPPRVGIPQGHHPHQHIHPGAYINSSGGGQYTTSLASSRNNNGYQSDSIAYIHQNNSPHSDAMKALEDENFMLKRRIEELKSSNEFLLNQNAQLRLNNSLSATLVPTSVAQVQPLAVSAVSVSGAGPSAQPTSIIGITSSSLSGTQPLPTISISTLPTVSSITPVSISQTLQPQPQTQTQIYLPAPPN